MVPRRRGVCCGVFAAVVVGVVGVGGDESMDIGVVAAVVYVGALE